MTTRGRRRSSTTGAIVLISVATWIVIALDPAGVIGSAHGHAHHVSVEHHHATHTMTSTSHPLALGLAGWMLMLLAMMTPTLVSPIRYVIRRSFRRRQVRSVALFATGYAIAWLLAGLVLTVLARGVTMSGRWSFVSLSVVGLVALVWQCTPLKQLCLNRGHHHPPLAAFGSAADRDAVQFGLTHGSWCVASCWLLMLFPMLLTNGHLVAMVAVSFWMISERLEPPRPLAWRLHLPGQLAGIIVARASIWLRSLAIHGTSESQPTPA